MVNQSMENMSIDEMDAYSEEDCNRYLIFELDKELYGVSLMDIKEVLKNRKAKEIPYMKSYFLGVINLRGKIVSVMDLRLKFKKQINPDKEGYIVIVEDKGNLVGVIVDDILTVENIVDSEVDTNPHLEIDFPMEFFIGVGKKKDRLINLIELSKCISKDDMRMIKK